MSVLDHIHVQCCYAGCAHVILMHESEFARLKRTHEWWYCPAGHRQHFAGKTEQEKRLERAERDAAQWERVAREWMERTTAAYEVAELLAAGVRTCPLGCGWTTPRRVRIWGGDAAATRRYLDRAGRDLTDHLVREHNATRKPIALLPAGDTAEDR